MAKHKNRTGARRQRSVLSPFAEQTISLELAQVERSMARQEWARAEQLLRGLDSRFPNRPEVLTAWAILYRNTGNLEQYENLVRRLVDLDPTVPETRLALASVCAQNQRPMLAVQNYRLFLEQWPTHPEADKVRSMLAMLEPDLDSLTEELGADVEDPRAFALLHEMVQAHALQGNLEEALACADKLFALKPDFAPAYNNLSQGYFIKGDLDGAIRLSERVLDIHPDNFHALSNLIRLYLLTGRPEDAQRLVEPLGAVEHPSPDLWIKRAEALALLGDDQGQLNNLAAAEATGQALNPLLYHLAAVATYRLGNEARAKQLWQKTLELDPTLSVAQANLNDLKQPVGERHAAWPYSFIEWVPYETIQSLSASIGRSTKDSVVRRATQRFVEKHPALRTLVPILLDRGDREGRIFAVYLASMSDDPALLEALKVFALSKRGPDSLRHDAMQKVSQAGLLPAGPLSMWLNGAWTEIILMGFELHGEEVYSHSPKALRLLEEGGEALQAGEAARAEMLLRQAYEIEPDKPDITNNLAKALELQGHVAEAEQMMLANIAAHPEYIHGRVALALWHIERGEIDEARAKLIGVLGEKRLHFADFSNLARGWIRLALAENDRTAGETWLRMWQDVSPEHPELPYWRTRLSAVRGEKKQKK